MTERLADPLLDPVPAAAHAVGVAARRTAVTVHGEGFVRAQLKARRWQQPADGVLVAHNGPLTEEQRMWVGLLASPPGTVLHGLSAACWDGLTGFSADHPSLVIPGSSRSPGRQRPQLPDAWQVGIRWSTMLDERDVSPIALPPRTRLPRSIVDAASERVPSRRSRVLVLAAVQQRLLTPADLWDALSRRGRCRNRAVIAESILDAGGGIDSLPEHEFDLIRRRRRLPEPTRQVVLRRRDGRFCLDTEWQPWGVRGEVHGIPHSFVRNWDRDLRQQNEIAIDGGGLLVFSSYAIRHLGDEVGDQLERMLISRGWRP